MVKYIANIPIGFVHGAWTDNINNDIYASRGDFFSSDVEPEVELIYDRVMTYLDLELKKANIATVVKVFPTFSYRTLWNEDEYTTFSVEDCPDEPNRRKFTVNTNLGMSAVIAYTREFELEKVHLVMINAISLAFDECETKYISGYITQDLVDHLANLIADPNSSDYILYRNNFEVSHSHPVPILQVQTDAFQCRRVLKATKFQWTDRVEYTNKHGDNIEWMGIGPCNFAFTTDDKSFRVSQGKYMLAKTGEHQERYLKVPPSPSSWNKFVDDLNHKHGARLNNLFSRLQESRIFDKTLPGVVAMLLTDGFFSPEDRGSYIMPDDDGLFGGLQLISNHDSNALNSVIFSLHQALNADQMPKQYYCLQGAVELSDLKKLLIASVGNVLVIYGDYGDSEYRRFLNNERVIEMLTEFKCMVQYVFLYNFVRITDEVLEAYKNGEILPLDILLNKMDITEKEVTILDFSTLDIKFSDESKKFLLAKLRDYSGDIGLIESFVNQYEKKVESFSNVVKDFRIFRDNQLTNKLQHDLNTTRKELGSLAEDDEKREEIISRLDYLTSALKGANTFTETKYSAAVDWSEELENLTGLSKVKEHIRELKSVFAARYARNAVDTNSKNVFTFEGNPGCGKTMVARYFAYCLKQDGLISAEEPFYDINISDIVGVHIGEASANIDRIFKECAGSVIFIDEAYSLLDESSFGRSAINGIVKNISSMSSDTVLILAGYPMDISRLLKKNRGLESRVVKRIPFDDYSCRELLDILKNNLNANCGLYYNSREAKRIENAIRDFLLRASSCGEHNTGRTLGNARFIENLISKLEIAHASTLSEKELKNRIASLKMLKNMSEDQSDDPEAAKELARANKLRTLTLKMVQEAIAKLDKELEQTGSANGSTRPTYYVPTGEKDTFDRVVGNKNAKALLKKQMDIFKHPDKYKYAPEGTRGILLTGDPGCGKTLLARAMAHEAGADVAFMSANSTDFIKGYLGQGAEALGELFAEVETYEKCILFIDEIDAIGAARGTSNSTGENQVLMKLLTCLDGFKRKKNFLVIAATNAPEILDPALRRRLGTQVSVELPNAEERLDILKLNLADRHSEGSISDEQLKRLADYECLGYSGDRISKCVTEAYFNSDGKPIKYETLEAALQSVITGFNGNATVSDAEKRITAYHEIGHAFLSHRFGMPVLKVSILPNDSGALGYALHAPSKPGVYSMTKADYENSICVSLGGRAAEELFSETRTPSSGCRDDLKHATKVALKMVTEYGMGSTLRVRETTDPDVQKEADKILENCYARTKEILNENAKIIHAITEKLVEKETLSKEDVETFLSGQLVNS